MFCTKCGNMLREDDLFCPKCGTSANDQMQINVDNDSGTESSQGGFGSGGILNGRPEGDPVKCPSCGALVWDDDKICMYCGNELPGKQSPKPLICPKCGETIPPGNKFCGECGASITDL